MGKSLMKSFINCGMLGRCLAFVVSCDDDGNLTAKNLATCAKGIMSGDQTGIDF